MEYRPILQRRAVVVGAGVTGLTSAIALLRDGWKVKIITDKISPNTLSDGPAAFWGPYLSEPEDKVNKWLAIALEEFLHLRDTDPSAGVWMIEGIDFSVKSEIEHAKWRDLLGWRNAKPGEIPKHYNSGVHYNSLMIEIPMFMSWLTKEFQQLGGVIEIRKLKSLRELFRDPFFPSIIVNCSGLGAYELCNDKNVYPIRGQVVKVDAPWVKNFYGTVDDADENGMLTYILPRSDCVILGGTALKGEWNTNPNPETTKEIIRRCNKVLPGIEDAPIKSIFVGLRPGRTAVRVEDELIREGVRHINVIHNYGHGGSGVTLSWGCAHEVVQLARKAHRFTLDLLAKL